MEVTVETGYSSEANLTFIFEYTFDGEEFVIGELKGFYEGVEDSVKKEKYYGVTKEVIAEGTVDTTEVKGIHVKGIDIVALVKEGYSGGKLVERELVGYYWGEQDAEADKTYATGQLKVYYRED